MCCRMNTLKFTLVMLLLTCLNIQIILTKPIKDITLIATEGDRVRIECQGKADADYILVKVKKFEKRFAEGGTGHTENGTFDQYERVYWDRHRLELKCLDRSCTLLFSSIKEIDSGSYSCEVDSIAWKSENIVQHKTSYEIQVRVPPNKQITQSDSTITGMIQVKCTAASGKPKVSHIWLNLVDEKGKIMSGIPYVPTIGKSAVQNESEERIYYYTLTKSDLILMSNGSLYFQCGFEQVVGDKNFFEYKSLELYSDGFKPTLIENKDENQLKVNRRMNITYEILSNPIPDADTGIYILLKNNCSVSLNFTNSRKWLVEFKIDNKTLSHLELRCKIESVTGSNLTIRITNAFGSEEIIIYINHDEEAHTKTYDTKSNFILILAVILISILLIATILLIIFYVTYRKGKCLEFTNKRYSELMSTSHSETV